MIALGVAACTAEPPLHAPAAPTPTAAPALEAVDRLCPGPPVAVSAEAVEEAALWASFRSFERASNGFHFQLADGMAPEAFFARYGPLLHLGPRDTLHEWVQTEPTRLQYRHGLCHDGVRVSGAGVDLWTPPDGPVTGGSVIVYRVRVSGQPRLSPADALAVARASAPALATCEDWALVFHGAWRDPRLVYVCRTGRDTWASFSADTGEIVEARRGPPQ